MTKQGDVLAGLNLPFDSIFFGNDSKLLIGCTFGGKKARGRSSMILNHSPLSLTQTRTYLVHNGYLFWIIFFAKQLADVVFWLLGFLD